MEHRKTAKAKAAGQLDFATHGGRWDSHFRLEGPRIVPLTAIGRATARLLRFSDTDRKQARRDLLLAGRYPG